MSVKEGKKVYLVQKLFIKNNNILISIIKNE